MKLKLVSALVITMAVVQLQAQTKYIDKNGEIEFEASEELFEPVKATNTTVTAILNADTGELASLALLKGFHFENSLMEEHFNENYIESETYPKAIFRGSLLNFNHSQVSETPTEVTVDGKLKLREKEKDVRTILSVQKVSDVIIMKGSFKVTPSDFDIEIPKIVANKIAKEVIVNLAFKLQAK
ncbi:MAG: hypothetical protein Mars2KO_43320 [Maribacter sp.]|uniref:YceI family protein n=1 Tax=Maribacter sp. 2307UL18-2 TaxID=3386274 RepID=UPI0039BC852E